jgi:predicted dehydrogenase
MKRIGVGIVGASPDGGWASLAHVPALRSLPDFELRAVATSRRASADAARAAFEVPAAYVDPGELARDPSVDLVVVSVRVPLHRGVVVAALEAGKHVFCEWPLGRSLAEAEELERLAAKRGVRSFIGLQARYAPAIRYARDLVAEGYVGEVFGSTLVGAAEFWSTEVSRSQVYVHDVDQGATMLTVPVLHALDAVASVVGEFESVSATLATMRKSVRITGEDASIVPTAPDEIAMLGRLVGGGVHSTTFRGGPFRGDKLRWEIHGSEGDLVLTADAGYMQLTPLRLAGGRGSAEKLSELPIPPRYELAGLSAGPTQNVGHLYAAIARDLREGTREVPDFALAVARHRLIQAALDGERSGQRQTLTTAR